jgi:nicotinamidase-related amidase
MRRMILLVLATVGCAPAVDTSIAFRPSVAGEFELHLRSRNKATNQLSEKADRWKASETAVILIDVWDDHYCKSAAQRVGVMVPKMNAMLTAARDHGAQIVHAPSDVIDIYADYPQRKRILAAKPATASIKLENWCYLDPKTEPPMPIDVSKCACDDPIVGTEVRKHTHQHPGIDITSFDCISANGQEIYNLFQQLGIKNVVILGVHTNMCILGRSFGIRQMTRLGFNVALVRDLTDTMYDPRQPPYVSHNRGTELVIEHIEKFWCPTIDSVDLMKIAPTTGGPK